METNKQVKQTNKNNNKKTDPSMPNQSTISNLYIDLQ